MLRRKDFHIGEPIRGIKNVVLIYILTLKKKKPNFNKGHECIPYESANVHDKALWI